MATIDFAVEGSAGNHPSRASNVKVPYLVEVEIDLAEAVVSKGSALASADVIQAIAVPADTVILFGGASCKEEMTGTSTDLSLDIGVTGVDVDAFVDGWDFDAASAGDYATVVGVNEPIFVTTADTIDILFAAQTGTVLTGVIRVFAMLLDVSDAKAPGLAVLGS
jgi:hypothetical protein